MSSIGNQEYQPATAVREYLEELAARMRTDSDVPITDGIHCGDPATAIIAAAVDRQASFVVMATHGRTGFQRMALGSVADGVLQHGRAPLVLVHPTPVPGPSRQPTSV